ncbi:hypothetical protein N334_02244, partial [Pelecanus crispus]
RANVYPTREFLARGRQDTSIKACCHCQAENETCSYITGYYPAIQEARIKRHNIICELLMDEAKKKDWVVFQERLVRDAQNELYKPDLVFVKEDQAIVVDVMIRYENKETSLADAAAEKVKKYQHLREQVQEITNVNNVKFMGFPRGAHGKWHAGNYKLLKDLGLSSSRQEKMAWRLSNWALFSSGDIVHMFVSRSR